MVVDVGARLDHLPDAGLVPLEVGDEHLDGAAGEALPDLPDGLGEDVRAEVGEVVAVDGGDDGVAQGELGDGLGHARRLLDVVRRGTPVGDGAVGAVPGADVAQDHEGGGAVLPALADVGAVRLLAHGVQLQLTHELLEAQVVVATGGLHLEPLRLPLGKRVAAVASHDLDELLSHGGGGEGRTRVQVGRSVRVEGEASPRYFLGKRRRNPQVKFSWFRPP